MPTTAHRRGCALLVAAMTFAAGRVAAEEEGPWLPVVAQLASSISQGDATGALAVFDRGMKDYGAIESNLEALAAQADVLCAIDVVEAHEQGDDYVLDVDWYLRVTPLADAGSTERRRKRVQLQLKKVNGRLKIAGMQPVDILDPLHIR